MADQIVPFDDTSGASVLKAELSELRQRRRQVFAGADVPAPLPNGTGIMEAHQFRALGIALSGGGIRSATFNLGILQGLASRKLLPYVDYLSTVSGGGFIGTWLHGVIRRMHAGDPRAAGERLDPVAYPKPDPAGHDPVRFLRKYSSYLAPRGGLFSADYWVIAAIWTRNMFLNQLILVPFLAAVVALALVVGCSIKTAPPWAEWGSGAIAAGLALFVLLAGAAVTAGRSLYAIAARELDQHNAPDPRKSRAPFPVVCILLVASALFWLHWSPSGSVPIGLLSLSAPLGYIVGVAMFLLMLLLQASGGFRFCFERLHDHKGWVWLHLAWMPAMAAAVTTVLLCGFMHLINRANGSWHAVIWGPPALVAALVTGVALLVGLMGADFPDASREWLGRVGAVLGMDCFAWIAIVGLAVYGPYGLAWLAWKNGGAAVAAILAWIGSTIAGVQAGKSPKTSGAPDGSGKSNVLEWILKIAPTVFMIGFLILIAAACHATIAAMGHHKDGARPAAASADTGDRTRLEITVPAPNAGTATVKLDTPAFGTSGTKKGTFDTWFAWLAPFVTRYDEVLNQDTCWNAIWILIVCGGVAAFLPLRFNINEFSMHHFYKNRLVRCYLGASNTERRPNRFTGFDSKDDLDLATLTPSDKKEPYFGPYAIVNTALNLNAGSELAKQERKATSFIFTPKCCGFDASDEQAGNSRLAKDAYRGTEGFLYAGGPRIGTAMGISGAAANPNWGYHTSASVAFLLTLFNVRLGWWVGNPRVQCRWKAQCPSQRPGPLYGLSWLIWELLGQTTGVSKYVNLSDGGHFENLGLYELVRRRCRYIIVGDGEQDNDYTFESLGGAIRKCRADFGVEIDIDVEQIRAAEAAKRTHCVVGTILYPEELESLAEQEPVAQGGEKPKDKRIRGWLLYLKASLTGDEPEDVKQYKAGHADFPQETTMNQFFTESQFESYRRLGLHVVQSAFENVKEMPDQYSPDTLRDMFQRMAALWYGPSNLAPGVATRHAEAYSALLKRLNEGTDISWLDRQMILKERPDEPPPTENDPAKRKAFFLILDFIQLMENVWLDFGLDVEENRNNPRNQGWMNVFRHWARQDFFGSVWEQAKQNFNPLFGDFVERLRRGA